VWHLYVATTYDGGATWTAVDATPTDPVQRGCIWLNGGSNPCRNLLDFNDMTIDKTGQVVVGYADGCTGTCATGGTNTHSSVATIAYQSGGLGLLKQFDPAAPGAPGNLAAKTAKKKGVTLTWSAPVTGGSATGYRIYRATSSGGETLLTSVGLVTTFKDTKTVSGTRYYYTVAAIGPGGEGPASSEASAVAK